MWENWTRKNNRDWIFKLTIFLFVWFFFQPETVPQAIIDMTKVLEVTTAEDVTSHINSLAITAPDRVTFVKGTCPEEAKWWLNILVAFPKTKVSFSSIPQAFGIPLFQRRRGYHSISFAFLWGECVCTYWISWQDKWILFKSIHDNHQRNNLFVISKGKSLCGGRRGLRCVEFSV